MDTGDLSDPAQPPSRAACTLTATHGSTTVTAEALNWGFWHFGEFSRAYRECFGELPSSTLQRKPTEPTA
ncbi:MAG: helix-turn-helix domain-containing protein [Betaproteobacteria bacterium]|nr:helix-turn-helix domain-containing protein [Betaproteobacteria bacterium]